jgi:hypothetical protein
MLINNFEVPNIGDVAILSTGETITCLSIQMPKTFDSGDVVEGGLTSVDEFMEFTYPNETEKRYFFPSFERWSWCFVRVSDGGLERKNCQRYYQELYRGFRKEVN